MAGSSLECLPEEQEEDVGTRSKYLLPYLQEGDKGNGHKVNLLPGKKVKEEKV